MDRGGGRLFNLCSNNDRNWELMCLADVSSSCSVAGTPSAVMSSKYYIILRRYSLHACTIRNQGPCIY